MSKGIRTAAQTAVLMAILTLISKLLGFVREMVLAGFFGASYVVDSYVMAQSIPNIIFAGILGAVATAYMPIFSREIELKGEEAGNLYTSQVINILLIISVIACLIGLLFSDQIVGIFASGFTGKTAELTSFFVKITFTYILFTSVNGILENYLRYKNTFLPQIIIGYSQNLIVIVTIIISAYYSYYLLVFGLVAAYIIRLVLMGRLSLRKGFRYIPGMKGLGDTGKKIAVLALPVFIGSSVSQINQFVDKTLASGLQEGSVSALNYGNLLVGMITGLTVTIITTIIYPKMTQAAALEDTKTVGMLLSKGVNIILMIAIPFTLGIAVFSQPVVQIVYERGAFDPAATSLTNSAFLCYGLGLVFLSLNTHIVQAFYSQKNMRTPVYCGIIGVIVNVTLNLILVRFMAHAGLALATSIAAGVNTCLLMYLFSRRYRGIQVVESWKKIGRIALAAAVSVGCAWGVYAGLMAAVWMPRMVYLGFAVLAAGMVYLAILKAFRVDELEMLRGILRR